jgi:hypothetical protein
VLRDTSTLFVPETGTESEAESNHTEDDEPLPLLPRSRSDNSNGDTAPDTTQDSLLVLADEQREGAASLDSEDMGNDDDERETSSQPKERRKNSSKIQPSPTEESPPFRVDLDPEPSNIWLEVNTLLGEYNAGYFDDAMEAGYSEHTPSGSQREKSTPIGGVDVMDGVQHEPDMDGVQHEPDMDGVQHEPDMDGVQHEPDMDGVQHEPDMDGVQHEPGNDPQIEKQHDHSDTDQALRLVEGEGEPLDIVDEMRVVIFPEWRPLDPVVNDQNPTLDTREQRPQSYANEPTFQSYLELALARRSAFRLPHESTHDPAHVEVPELLLPLVEEVPLTTQLIHGLLHALLPGTVRVLEVCSDNVHDEISENVEPTENFAAIVYWTDDSQVLLVLGVEALQTIFIIGSSLISVAVSQEFPPPFLDWDTKFIDVSRTIITQVLFTDSRQPDTIGPHIERTLLSVFLAEACFCSFPIGKIPSSRDLRLRYLQELLAPYERDYVLEHCGIPTYLTSSHKADTRVIARQSTAQVVINNDTFPNFESFDMSALRKAFVAKPQELSRVRTLRILQCVNEIGSPNILDSIKSALMKQPEKRTAQTLAEPIVEKLSQIHIYLDTQESRSHLLVAKNRYIKFSYFETVQFAAETLQRDKQGRVQEKHRALCFKSTTSYKRGFCDKLLDTPHSDSIKRAYGDLPESKTNRRSLDVVKDKITQKVMSLTQGSETRIRKNINRYIKEGRVLHHILQGSTCLNPSLLILFPGSEKDKPSLDLEVVYPDLDNAERRKLSKPIDIKE